MWSQPKTAKWTNATGGEQFERLLWQDVKQKDWKSVEEHLAPTYVLTSSAGVRDRGAALDYFKQLDLRDVTISDLAIQPGGTDMVVTYTATLSTAAGERKYVMSTVWQQQKKGWMALTHSEAPAQ